MANTSIDALSNLILYDVKSISIARVAVAHTPYTYDGIESGVYLVLKVDMKHELGRIGRMTPASSIQRYAFKHSGIGVVPRVINAEGKNSINSIGNTVRAE